MKLFPALALLSLALFLPGCGNAPPSIAVGEMYIPVESRLQKHGAKQVGQETGVGVAVYTWTFKGKTIKVSVNMGKVDRIEVGEGEQFQPVQEFELK